MVISRQHPVPLKILRRELLTKEGSSKCTYHLTLSTVGSGLTFKVGDSLGIYSQNDPVLVRRLIHAMGAEEKDPVTDPKSGEVLTLWDFLSYKANLSRITSEFLKFLYKYTSSHDEKNALGHLLEPESKPLLTAFLTTHDPLDLFLTYPVENAPLQERCALFSPLLPRFYSVASSQAAFPDQVDLTVALTTYQHGGEKRYGVGSHFLCHLAEIEKTPIPSYVQTAPHFSLPADDAAPIILVGPGTGIAPFRAFLQERMARNAPGKNWLFFGERNRATDYFYGDYLEELSKQQKLELDLAFSRDGAEKIYVQHLMYAKKNLLWKWLQEGAYFYVCGDAHKMAKDVEMTLQKIAQEEGAMSEEAAKLYVRTLRKEKRYLADVY
ncbi:MAG: sulfite reductase [Verrucomicrobia bacterium]|nr:sulfite reductase [Verrucomicrobiota bacterium]